MCVQMGDIAAGTVLTPQQSTVDCCHSWRSSASSCCRRHRCHHQHQSMDHHQLHVPPLGGVAGMVVVMLMPQVSTLVSHPCCRCCSSTVCASLSLMMVWRCDFHLLLGSFNNSAAVDVWESVITIVVASVVVPIPVVTVTLYQYYRCCFLLRLQVSECCRCCNTGDLIFRTGFWGILYHNFLIRNPPKPYTNSEGPCSLWHYGASGLELFGKKHTWRKPS